MENDEREKLKKQRQKWLAEKALDERLENAGINSDSLKSSSNPNLLTEITLKLSEKLQNELNNNRKCNENRDNRLEKNLSKEIETNTCPICYELMVPPRNSPILLFPCGHTFCKSCVGTNNKNVQKCPCCRAAVKSSALNISLQNLICTFTNNKHLLEKYGERSEDEPSQNKVESNETFANNLHLCKVRCKILKEEKTELIENTRKVESKISSQQKVIYTLYDEKKGVEEKIAKMKKELDLINDFIDKNEQDLHIMEQERETSLKKIDLIQMTLVPIEQEKQKYELLTKSLK